MPTGLFTLSQVNQAIRQGAWTGFIPPTWVEYLVVAGGGGGGSNGGAGGGGGGLLTGVVTIAANTSYTVTVGAGGTTGSSSSGTNSVFGVITASGGGAGGRGAVPATEGLAGGSGGGSAAYDGVFRAGAQGIAGQGNAGGPGLVIAVNQFSSAGGGGAGTVGLGAPALNIGGNGGAGIASAISGTVTAYAGGGGAYGGATNGTGGVGGGGDGLQNGGANTGGGGGGSSGSSGNAGSGVVIVRYPGTVQYFTGGTLSYANGYVIHTFNASGTFAPTTPTPYIVEDYQISRSLRFNSADSAYLNRTPATATNRRTWTWSGWVKRSSLGARQGIFVTTNSGATDFFVIEFDAADKLNIQGRLTADSIASIVLPTIAVYRDTSAWYHLVVVLDTTQATNTNRVKAYINGTQVVFDATAPNFAYPSQNTEYRVNTTNSHTIGQFDTLNILYLNGYMTEINLIDGQALTPSSFGYYNFNTGVWSPTRYVGVYGTNGFYLNFSDNSNTTAATLGADYSGNGNNWTPNNFSVSAGVGNDSLVDVPTNWGVDTGVGGTVRGNYCTLNPLSTTSGTYTQGNLRYVGPNTGSYVRSNGTLALTTGKWYWEVTLANAPFSPRDGSSAYNAFGFGVSTTFNSTTSLNSITDAVILQDSGFYKNFSGSVTDGGTAFSSGDVLAVAVDLDANTFTFYRNNTQIVTGTIGGTAGRELVPIIISYSSAYGVMDCNFGQRPFAYTAPSGFKALNTQNLPTPTIGATPATQAGKFFNPVLYTGSGSSLSVTGVGFQPDWTWIKLRSAVADHALYDVVRGVQKQLESNNTSAETTETNGLTAFGSDGFTVGTLGQVNGSGSTYVAWNWKANGAGVTNTAGTITSTVSANTTSGFSVVTFTGNSIAGATIGHGLGVAPAMVIMKNRVGTDGWQVYHRSLPSAAYRIQLQSTAAADIENTVWNSTAPTSTIFSVGTNVGNDNQVAYCFAEVPGYSRFGSYTGNGSADGPFVFTGMRPAFVMLKNTTTAGNAWHMIDTARGTYNVYGPSLDANFSGAEITYTICDLLSNGLKLRDTNQAWNKSGDVYIFMAFASNPFKFALAR